jgi:acetyl-CoA C-acetyltransferase
VQKRFYYSKTSSPVGTDADALVRVPTHQHQQSVPVRGDTHRGVKPEQVDELFMSNVASAGIGHAFAQQAGIFGPSYQCALYNFSKICASNLSYEWLVIQHPATLFC